LSENYVPASLTKIDPGYVYNTKTDLLFYSETLPFLNVLMSTAQVDKIDIKVISAYRSFGTQSGLKSSYKVTYGTGANKFSADQGYSEHQLGTAVDFTTSTVGDSFTGFEKTPAYQWLVDNAYNYGFIMSYPKGNAYYQYEPWHWRFVGRALAQKLHDEGKNFYDLDQRDIDQYLISFFD
jgi:D-alanyl-D-alanine carboxypeptidase